MIKKYSVQGIEARMEAMGMCIPDFHLVGIRSKESVPDRFDDAFYIIADHNLQGHCPYDFTSNPGKHWLENLLNPAGTFILAADEQYYNCFKLGLHKGKEALIQAGNLRGHRDNNNDGKEQEIGEIITITPSARVDIHGANDWVKSIFVGKYSAGCQVIADPANKQELLTFCKATAKGLFTYSLLKEW